MIVGLNLVMEWESLFRNQVDNLRQKSGLFRVCYGMRVTKRHPEMLQAPLPIILQTIAWSARLQQIWRDIDQNMA